MQFMRRISAYCALALALCSCSFVTELINDDEVVAKVGDTKLRRSDVMDYIPDFVTGEDSLHMAEKFINSWAAEQLFLDLAKSQLSAQEMDVTRELEDYRKALIRYRYEQHYVNDRLDTLVTQNQIAEYYEANRQDFELERPILKVRFVDVMNDSPYRDAILKMMSSSDLDDLERADTLAASSALRYFDSSETWKDAAELAREFGVDHVTMLSRLEDSQIRILDSNTGELKVAFVQDIQKSGIAPVEFCSESIRDIILSGRKRELIAGLERDLLEDALEKNNFVIY